MSKKLQQKLSKNQKKFTITVSEMGYLVDIDRIQKSLDYYHNQLKINYLQQVAIRLGYDPKDQLEFSIDLASESRELSIKKVDQQ